MNSFIAGGGNGGYGNNNNGGEYHLRWNRYSFLMWIVRKLQVAMETTDMEILDTAEMDMAIKEVIFCGKLSLFKIELGISHHLSVNWNGINSYRHQSRSPG